MIEQIQQLMDGVYITNIGRNTRDHIKKLREEKDTPRLRKLIWTSQDGRSKPIHAMHDNHLLNTINKFEAGDDFLHLPLVDEEKFDLYLLLRLERRKRSLKTNGIAIENKNV